MAYARQRTSGLLGQSIGRYTSGREAGASSVAEPRVAPDASLLTTITDAVKGTRQKRAVESALERSYAHLVTE